MAQSPTQRTCFVSACVSSAEKSEEWHPHPLACARSSVPQPSPFQCDVGKLPIAHKRDLTSRELPIQPHLIPSLTSSLFTHTPRPLHPYTSLYSRHPRDVNSHINPHSRRSRSPDTRLATLALSSLLPHFTTAIMTDTEIKEGDQGMSTFSHVSSLSHRDGVPMRRLSRPSVPLARRCADACITRCACRFVDPEPLRVHPGSHRFIFDVSATHQRRDTSICD